MLGRAPSMGTVLPTRMILLYEHCLRWSTLQSLFDVCSKNLDAFRFFFNSISIRRDAVQHFKTPMSNRNRNSDSEPSSTNPKV